MPPFVRKNADAAKKVSLETHFKTLKCWIWLRMCRCMLQKMG